MYKKVLLSVLFFLTGTFSVFSQKNSSGLASIEPHLLTPEEQIAAEFSTEVPDLLKGIWQGNDRLVLFAGDDSSFACVLRVFYQWYDDRAAEPERYAQVTSRDRNDTTAIHAENIEVKFRTIVENSKSNSGAYELQIKYPGLKEYVYIPLAITGGNMYLNFFVRQNFYEEIIQTESDGIVEKRFKLIPDKFYLKDTGVASGITISPPVIKKELLSYFIDGPSIYHIRYWLSDMNLNDESAEFTDGEQFYSVNKFLYTAGKLYTCTTGRAHKIRNIQKSSSLPYNFITDEEQCVYVYGKPYLTYVTGSGDRKQLQEMVDKNNVRRHPPVQPLFPVSDINFHWKEISDLEKYNPYTWNRRNLDVHK